MDFNEETRDLLEDVIQDKLKDLDNYPVVDKDDNRVKDLVSLYQLKIDEERLELDMDTEVPRFQLEEQYKEVEANQKEKELKDQRIDRFIGYCISAAGLLAYAYFIHKGYKYEYKQSGMYTSTTLRTALNRLTSLIKRK